MTRPIVCKTGRCKDAELEFLDECLDCTLAQQIEHDLLKNNAADV